MSFILQNFYNLSLFILAMTYSLKTIDRFSELVDLLQELKLADAQIIACAQSKANQFNLIEAHQILQTFYPQYAAKLNLAKEDLENFWPSYEGKCEHSIFTQISPSAKRQNPKQKNSWPNWILSINENF